MARIDNRQAVISVFKFDESTNAISKTPTLEIPFRQPFNNFGLDFSFSFLKTYFAPYSAPEMKIFNMSSEQVDAFEFNSKTYKKRPLIKLYGGYTDFQQQTDADINQLKSSLSLLFEGHPTFTSDDKLSGGRVFTLRMSDISAQSRTKRSSKLYRIGTLVLVMLRDLAKAAKMKVDFSKLEENEKFAARILKKDLMFNNNQIVSQVFPRLRKSFKFTFDVNASGIYVFRPAKIKGPVGALITVNAENGLIEHPTSINWVYYKVKTFFGRPDRVFFPADWLRIESNVFDGGVTEALVVEAAYNWEGDTAICEYIVSPSGKPLNGNPILTI